MSVSLVFSGQVSFAQSAEGVWRTEPDHRGQTAHVVARPCGVALCGTIEKVFDKSGQSVQAPTIGTRVFWDMRGSGGVYAGRAYVPAFKKEYKAQMRLRGNQLTVSGCLGPVCKSQTWKRVR